MPARARTQQRNRNVPLAIKFTNADRQQNGRDSESLRFSMRKSQQRFQISDQSFVRCLITSFKGEYDAILTWAPDRLARNMKEAGEIIDFLDKGDIKDMKFANGYYFQNDAAGKMMLGIAFVQAKQFSDQHAQNIRRSVTRITAEGKCYGRPKHGYYKDANQYLRPDGENWQLVRRAFEMRLSRQSKYSLKEIATWLREHSYPLKTKHTKQKPISVDEKFLSDLFRDPFYAGALVYGGQVVNLCEKFSFEPIITPPEFDLLVREEGINKKFRLTEIIKPQGSVKANLMRGMVLCGCCNRPMSTGITPKKLPSGTRHYFYYRCDTHGCAYRGKSVRAKVILEAAYAFLDSHPMNFNKGYEAYRREMSRLQGVQELELASRLKSLHQQRKALNERIRETKSLLTHNERDAVLAREFKADLKKHVVNYKELEEQIFRIEKEQENRKEALQGYKEFIELFRNLAKYIKKIRKMDDLDYIMRRLFMNFVVEGKKVAGIRQNSPFQELYESSNSAVVALSEH